MNINFENCLKVQIKGRSENGVEPTIFIVDENKEVHMITISTSQTFIVTDEGKLGDQYIIDENNDIVYNDKLKEKEFIWSDNLEDEYLYKYGLHVCMVAGCKEAIQKFVEALSYKIESKCDFAYTAGRAHIDCMRNVYDKAVKVINNKEFMDQFIVPYSDESINNKTYFEIL